MIIGISGTPCAGKTSTSAVLQENYNYRAISLNQEIKERELYEEYDQESGSYVVEIGKVIPAVKDLLDREEGEKIILEGHLAHRLPRLDLLFVLRTHPSTLRQRMEDKGWKEKKIEENLEAEALDLILQEAVGEKEEGKFSLFEIDTTDKDANETAEIIANLVRGEQGRDTDCDPDRYQPGNVDWSAGLSAIS